MDGFWNCGGRFAEQNGFNGALSCRQLAGQSRGREKRSDEQANSQNTIYSGHTSPLLENISRVMVRMTLT